MPQASRTGDRDWWILGRARRATGHGGHAPAATTAHVGPARIDDRGAEHQPWADQRGPRPLCAGPNDRFTRGPLPWPLVATGQCWFRARAGHATLPGTAHERDDGTYAHARAKPGTCESFFGGLPWRDGPASALRRPSYCVRVPTDDGASWQHVPQPHFNGPCRVVGRFERVGGHARSHVTGMPTQSDPSPAGYGVYGASIHRQIRVAFDLFYIDGLCVWRGHLPPGTRVAWSGSVASSRISLPEPQPIGRCTG
mmetsp:Transcript_47746/g.132536  ORF Transcript_47746/g.132536 Transcript_47746/m.132536 type:complete len:254 (+) Transcript_47746:2472-3233(+)